MVLLSKMGVDNELDGVVCSPHEVAAIRSAIGHKVIVTPGIRQPSGDKHDQVRTGDAAATLKAGADYLVIGRALIGSEDPDQTLQDFGFTKPLANHR